MRVFAKPTGLERLSLEARVVYTTFALFLLIGYATSAWLYLDDDLGVSSVDAVRYYRGEEPITEVEPDSKEVVIELPTEEVATAGMRIEKPARQVVETFHFHLFSVPVCLLIIAHLFMMSGFATRTKVVIILVSSVSTLLHLVAPVLIRFVSPSFGGLMFPSALAMGLTWLFMTLEPVVEMWVGFAARDSRQAKSKLDVGEQ